MSIANNGGDDTVLSTAHVCGVSDTRDRIIATYREEIKNLQVRERDF